MPLITKVLQPELFTAQNLAFLEWTEVKGHSPESYKVNQAEIDAMEKLLDALVESGMLGE